MEQNIDQIRQQQKETWNKFSPGWKKWDTFTMEFILPMGEAIIAELNLKKNDIVLDVATGTGEPGLSIAKLVTGGKVVGTDISEGMLAIAKEQAKAQGIANYEVVIADTAELPFEDNYFDAISCRFGFMFFPDMPSAAKELVRVLKPGGKIATTIWGSPADNPWVTAIMGPIHEVMQIPPSPPGTVGIFRCAAPELMEDLFRATGFRNIKSKEISWERDFISEDFYWTYENDVIAPVVSAMGKASVEQKEEIRTNVFENLHRLNPAGGAKLKCTARIISAEK